MSMVEGFVVAPAPPVGRPEPLPLVEVGELMDRCDRLQMIALAADRALIRLSHPTVDYDAVPREVLQAALMDLQQSLAGLTAEDHDQIGTRPPAPLRRDLWEW